MNQVKIPKSELVISRPVFGMGRLGGTIQRFDKQEALTILRTARDAGVGCFDTADIYAQGNSERLLAEVFGKRRDSVVYATKGGYVLSAKALLLAKIKPLVRRLLGAKKGFTAAAGRVRGSQMAKDYSRSHLTRAVEGSLARLKTDYIDLYQLHSPDPAHLTPEVFETLRGLKTAGKIRAFGVSALRWDDIPLCVGQGVSWMQLESCILAGAPEAGLLKAAAADDLLLVARQTFGAGLLTRDPATWEAADCGGSTPRLAAARERYRILAELGDPHEVILRYLNHHSPLGAFIFATTRLGHLQSNLSALALPPFAAGELARLAEALA